MYLFKFFIEVESFVCFRAFLVEYRKNVKKVLKLTDTFATAEVPKNP